MADEKEAPEGAAENAEAAAGESEVAAPENAATSGALELKGLLGRKIGCSSVFRADGSRVPVTLIEAGPCTVIDSRTPEKNGYGAVQLGFGPKKMQRVTKPLQGQFKRAKTGAFYLLREFKVKSVEGVEPGQTVTVNVFKPGDLVDVTGTSKGKGFQGGVKRYGWSGGRASHGSMFHRAPGSIGASAWPSHVARGHRMPGHMGHARRTVQNLEVVEVRPEQNILVVRGAVPGPRHSYVLIREGRDPRTAAR
ncbi:MAG: 50S ribosomal protein L3 [Deltaproteobacteria bacterium]|nr:50S ribosomal protein L3 [Deltaproteobacteria bacterium]